MRTLKILVLLLLALLLTSTALAQSGPVTYRMTVGEGIEFSMNGTMWRVECGAPQPTPPISSLPTPDLSEPNRHPDSANQPDKKSVQIEGSHDARFGLEGTH